MLSSRVPMSRVRALATIDLSGAEIELADARASRLKLRSVGTWHHEIDIGSSLIAHRSAS